MPPQPTNAGIVTDASGGRHIPESVRADGSTRRAIRIRPGYKPPEDVEVYKNRTAESFRRGQGVIPGAESLQEDKAPQTSAAANKNAKRREARKKSKAAGEQQVDAPAGPAGAVPGGPAAAAAAKEQEEADPEAEREKKARSLRKKLKQAKELQDKKDTGGVLLPEQIAKVIRINELVRELDALGFDADGAPNAASRSPPAATAAAPAAADGEENRPG